MRSFTGLIIAALAFALLAGSAAAQNKQADKELEKVRLDLAAAQKSLTETKDQLKKSQMEHDAAQKALTETRDQLKKSQADQAAAQKTLTETKDQLKKSQMDQIAAQAQIVELTKMAEALGKNLEAAKAEHYAPVTNLNTAIKEAASAKADLVMAQKSLTDAQAKNQTDQTAHQKKLAEIHEAAEQTQKKLEVEIQNAQAKLDATNKQAAALRNESAALAAKLAQTNMEVARTKAELSAVEKTLSELPPRPVTIVVTLPADAKLMFDDHLTTSKGGQRVFVAPPMSVGHALKYTLKADVTRDGKVITMTKQIEIRGGDKIEVTLTLPPADSVDRLR